MVVNQAKICFSIIMLSLCTYCTSKCEFNSILEKSAFVIMSQKAHSALAMQNKNTLQNALNKIGINNPQIILLHEIPILGGWSIFPILKTLLTKYPSWIKWFIFLDEKGSVNLKIMEELINEMKDEVFIGRALQDQHPVIIHFYDKNPGTKYPDFSAGFGLSRNIVHVLSTVFLRTKNVTSSQKTVDLRWDYTVGNILIAGAQ